MRADPRSIVDDLRAFPRLAYQVRHLAHGQVPLDRALACRTSTGAIMGYSLGEAARAAHRTKPTILRAIRAGKLSATKDEASGAWAIEPAELHRLYPGNGAVTPEPVLQPLPGNDALQVEVTLLREQIAELREDRDRWRGMAERLLLTAPQPKRRWWSIRRQQH